MFAATQVHSQVAFGTLCEVCQKPINTGMGIAGEQVCRSFECIRIMKQKQTLPPLLFANMLKIQSQIVRDQEVRAKAEEQRKNALDEQIDAEDASILRDLQTCDSNPLPLNSRIISVASGSTQVTNLAEKRKRAFRDHLNKTISIATSNAKIEDIGYTKNTVRIANNEKNLQRLPALGEVTNATCSQCKGGCCVAGVNKAFVEAPLVRRVMAENKGMRPRDVYQMYMDSLPKRSIKGSCVYHTDKGCHLPREMRSDVCNGYLCDSLNAYHKAAVEQEELIPALVISRGHRQFHRYDDGAHLDVVSVSVFNTDHQELIDVQNI